MNIVVVGLIVFTVNLALIGPFVRRPHVVDDQTPVVGPSIVFSTDPDVRYKRKLTNRHRMYVAETSPRNLQSSRHLESRST